MTWRERSDWTRTSEAKIFRAREEIKISATPYATVALDSNQTEPGAGAPAPAYGGVVTAFESRRENGKASELRSEAFSICSPDWTRTSNPSINSRMLCQLSYGGLFCFRCWFPLQRVITIPGLFGLRNLKCYEVHHFWGVWLVWVVREASTPRYSPATCRTQDIRQVAGAFTRNRT